MHRMRVIGALLLVAAISLVTQIGCVSPEPAKVEEAEEAPSAADQQISALQTKVAALEAEVASLTAEVAAAQVEVAAAQAEVAAAQVEVAAAQAGADAAQADATSAQAALSEAAATVTSAEEVASQAQAETEQVQAEVEALLAAAPSPGIMIAPEQLDVSLLDLDSAQISLAGPDTIFVSSIMYDGQPYSALLKYHGGTTATVERVYGTGATRIPDSVDLSQTKLSLVAPNILDVANVGVSGNGYSGQLRYTGGNELEVAGIQRVTLPPTAAEQIASLQEQLAAAQAEAAQAQAAASAAEAAAREAEAATAAAEAATGAAMTEADAAREAAAAAQAQVDTMQGAAYQPSAVSVSAERLDARLLSLDGAQVSLAGPDRVYVSSIEYAGESYSALLRYRGGTTATVEQVYGPQGKLIPDTVGLTQTELAFVAPDVLDVAYVEIGGQGYAGQLRYAGGNRLEVAGIRQVTLPPTAAEQVSAAAAAEAAEAEAAAAAAVADAEAMAAAAVSEAEAAEAAAEAATGAAMAEAEAAREAAAAAAAAQAQVDMMQAAAYQPSAVSVSAERLDARLLSLDGAQVSLAGPDRVYVSSIEYAGESYSALLRYRGGTTATVEQVYGPQGKLIPDTVGLTQTELAFVAPDVLDVAYVEIGGQGYAGQLRYAGGNRLEVAGIRQVTLPPTAAEQVSEAAAAEVAEAEAAAAAAVADAEAMAAAAESEAEAAEAATAAAEAAVGAAMAEADAAREAAAAAQAQVDMMQAEAYQPSAVSVSAERLDARLLSLDGAQASLAGPDRVYVSSIEYAGESYSALLRYQGGTTATVEQVYGPQGKLIPDTVGLTQTELAFVAPDVLDVAYVEVDGQGYAGQLRYAGGNRLEVAGIRQVTLPPTAAEQVSAAAAAAVAEAEAAAAAAVAEAQAAADTAVADAQAEAAVAVSEAAAEVAAAQAVAAAAQAQVDMMQAEAHQPSAVSVSAERLDARLLSLDGAKASLAGPDRVYVSSIEYAGESYSALLRYRGGTTATVEQVYGPQGKLIPDTVGLTQTELAFVAPDVLDVAYVEVDGQGYAGQLRYAGGNRLEVAGIRQVTLPPTAAEQVSAAATAAAAEAAEAEAAAAAAVADAEAMAAAAESEAEAAEAAAEAAVGAAMAEADAAREAAAAAAAQVDAMQSEAYQPSAVSVSAERLDARLLSLDGAQVSLAGPDRVYVSSIEYAGESYSALLRYRGGTTATVEQVYGPQGKLIPDTVGLTQTELAFVAPDVLDVAYVEIGGQGYAGQLRYAGGNRLEVAGIRQVTLPPTAAEQVSAAATAAAEAEAAAAAAVADAEAMAAAAESEAEAAEAATAAAAAATGAAMAEAEAAREAAAAAAAQVDTMQAEAYQPSAVSVSAERLDAGLLSLDGAQASLAGPDRVYVSSIEYAGESYSALLRYRGGTTATVEQVYGPQGKLIPDTVGLTQTELAFVAPDVLDVAYVEVDGQGYAGQLRYAGGNRLEVAGIRQVTLPPTAAEQVSAAAAAEAAEAEAAAAAAVADAEAMAAAAVSEAEAAEAAAEAAAGAAMTEAEAAREAAAAAQAQVDMMQAEAYQPSAVSVSAERLDARLLSLDGAQASLAGPDRVYVSSIEYAGESYSALLRYRGGTTATVEQVYGPQGKLIPDTVGLTQTELAFVAPDVLDVAYVEVGGQGYAGQLRYAGGNRLEVAGIRQVTLPPTAAEQVSEAAAAAAAEVAEAEAAAAAAVAEAQAAADTAVADAHAEAAVAVSEAEAAEAATAAAEAAAGAAMTEADAAREAAAAAAAQVDMMQAAAYQPSAVSVSAERLDARLLSLDGAQVSLAGPDRVYVSSIEYAGESYSALLRYRGGTTATVEQVYGPQGKLIPDTVGLTQTELAFVAPDVLDVAYVEIGGQGYAGQLRYAGGNRLEVAGIRQVTLPPTAAAQVSAAAAAEAAEAKAAADTAVAAAEAAANTAVADAREQAAGAVSAAELATAAAEAAAGAAMAEAAAAQAQVDMMPAAAYEPSAVRVAAGQLVPGRLSFDAAQVSLAGPNAIYVSSIKYDGESYSALLKYHGGTTATVEQVYGPRGKLIPDSVGLSQTQLAFAAPDVLNISYVEVDGQGYSGQLRYAGDNRLEVAGIQRVTLPPTAAQQVSAAEAAAAAAIADAEAAAAATVADAQAAAAVAMSDAEAAAAAAKTAAADAAQARAELGVLMQDLEGRRVVPSAVDFNLLDLDLARVSVAGPESIYISGIRYDGRELSAQLRYLGDNRGVVEALFDTGSGGLPELDLSVPAIKVMGPETLVISNVGIGGIAYSFTLRANRDGAIVITQQHQGHRVRTAAELLRDELLSSAGVERMVSGISGGMALPDQGTWITSAAGVVSQTDVETSHAKFSIRNVLQPAEPTLYGVSARAGGGQKVGYGLHFLASGTPQSGNTWNFGRSYLIWATRERDFYDTEATQVQLYESLDGNRLMWLNSRNLMQGLSSGLTLEALYDPDNCPQPMGAAPCNGSITVLVDGMEQFKVAVSADIARQTADTIALRALGGPVEFTDLYVHSR